MATQRIILIVIVCFSMTGVARQTMQEGRARYPILKKGMTDVEKSKAVQEWRDQRTQPREKMARERINLMARGAWKRLLRISERQWKPIEPKVDKVQVVGWTKWACALCAISGREQRFGWRRHSEGAILTRAKAPEEMTEGHRIADELVDLLEDENSKDEEIRKKIDALQQVREQARKEWAAIGQELAPLLTTPRQEAIFLIMGYID